MAKDQKSISITIAEFEVLGQARRNFEELINKKISWGAYLVALSSGALATYAIGGQFSFACPNCGGRMEMRYVKQK